MLNTKETKGQDCFIFLTPKYQKNAKPKKLAFDFCETYLAFVALRSWLLVFNFRSR
jgi:hypothetical protein